MAKIDRKEIEAKVKEILAKELGIKPENITLEKRLVDDAVEITFELESKFELVKDQKTPDGCTLGFRELKE